MSRIKHEPRASFAFIGSCRAGSSWFFEILREHPQVVLPQNKGTLFFSNLYDMGVAWYEGFYPTRLDGRIAGEVCERYLSSPEALARIRGYRPDMRLICCIRNPYERAVSAWRFFVRNGVGMPSIAAEGILHPDIFRNGYYATQLGVARELFPEHQLLVIVFDDLARRPEAVARQVYAFIGADPDFVPSSLRRRVNGNAVPRSRSLARLVHDVHMRSWGRSRWASKAVGMLKRIRPLRRLVVTALYRDESRSADWADFIPAFPEEVVARYEQEIRALEKMLRRDLSHWHAPAAGAAGTDPRTTRAGAS